MAMSAMRAPMARRHLKTQCMTPTWSPLRLKQSDSIPHSTQSALWYSPTKLPLSIQWFSPTSLLQSAVWFNQTEKKEQTYDLESSPWAACVVACWSSVSIICTVMQLCSLSSLNSGVTSPSSLKEWNKLEPINKGGDDAASNYIKSAFRRSMLGPELFLSTVAIQIFRKNTNHASPVSWTLTAVSLWRVTRPRNTVPASWIEVYPSDPIPHAKFAQWYRLINSPAAGQTWVWTKWGSTLRGSTQTIPPFNPPSDIK